MAGNFVNQTGDWRVEINQSPVSSLQSPLHRKRIVITRSREQAASFAGKLTRLGAEPVVFPVIQFAALPPEPLDSALAQFEQYDWIVFTSINAVEFFLRRVDELGLTLKLPRVATVGSATAVALQTRRIPIDSMPEEFTGKALAAGLGDLSGQKVLLPRAKIGRPQIVELLREQGAFVDDIALYDTVTAVPTPDTLAQLQQGFDVITFTSPSSVRNFLEITNKTLPDGAVVACIGPVTAGEAGKNGLKVVITPSEYTIDGLIQAIIDYFQT